MRLRAWLGYAGVLGLLAVLVLVLVGPSAAGRAGGAVGKKKAEVAHPANGAQVSCRNDKAFLVVHGVAETGVVVDSVVLSKGGTELAKAVILHGTDKFVAVFREIDCQAAGTDPLTLKTTFKTKKPEETPDPDTRMVKLAAFKKEDPKNQPPRKGSYQVSILSPTGGTTVPTSFYASGTCDAGPVPTSILTGPPGVPPYNGTLIYFDTTNFIFAYNNIAPGTYTLHVFQDTVSAQQSPIFVQ
jgi:hypothetical protein